MHTPWKPPCARSWAMPTLDLPPDYLDDVLRLLASHVPAAEVWAYGSRINGRAHEGSDLDLVVRNPEDLSRPQRDLCELRGAFAESGIPILVEVLDWPPIPEEFRRVLARAPAVLCERANTGPPPGWSG